MAALPVMPALAGLAALLRAPCPVPQEIEQGGGVPLHAHLTADWRLWALFSAVVLGILFLDLFVLHRKAHVVRMREAAITGGSFVALALAFCGLVAWKLGAQPAQEFLTGYVVELSLSFDNLFVFLVLFRYFQVPREHQHRVLFWGILGALVLRAVFIVAGAALLDRFHGLIYVFGLFLVFTGVKLLGKKDDDVDPGKSVVLRLARRLLPVTTAPPEGRFFVMEAGRRHATTLFLCLVCVEATDVVFAVDSIPAIFGVTRDPFVVYTSNVFAILGLRSFYVLLALLMAAFRYLNYGLAFVLIFIGAKMLATGFDVHVDTNVSLGVVFGILGVAVAASLLRRHDPPAGVGRAGALEE